MMLSWRKSTSLSRRQSFFVLMNRIDFLAAPVTIMRTIFRQSADLFACLCQRERGQVDYGFRDIFSVLRRLARFRVLVVSAVQSPFERT
jgi:hypothetical protein